MDLCRSASHPLGTPERPLRSDLNPVSEGERVLDVHTRITNRVLYLGVTEQAAGT
jgi:hypothetical protein